MIAQGAHASMAVLTQHKTIHKNTEYLILNKKKSAWLNGPFTKIVVGVDSEEELLKLHKKAEASGMICSLIQDAGRTEFKGIPTFTAIAIGPDLEEEVDLITGNLSLL